MDLPLFCYNDEQWANAAPHLLATQQGPQREDDWLTLSGIMRVLQVGCRGADRRKEYGPYKTICNRFARWNERGI